MFSKKAIFTVVLALMAFTGLQAQSIRKNDRFTDGFREWTVEEVRMGIYVYMIDGQGDEITLKAEEGESGTYTLIPSRQADDPPFASVEFGWKVVFMHEDGNLILAILDPYSNKVEALHPLVEREDFSFKAEFLTEKDSPESYDRIVVKGSAGSSFAPEFVTELELTQTLYTDDSRITNLDWVNDKVDLNFDGIPDLVVYLGTLPVRGAPSKDYAYVWDPDDHCFKSVLSTGFAELEVNPDTKTLTSSYPSGPDVDVVETYVWEDGKLKRVLEDEDFGIPVYYQGSRPTISDFASALLFYEANSDVEEEDEGFIDEAFNGVKRAFDRKRKGLKQDEGTSLTVDEKNGYLLYEWKSGEHSQKIEMCYWNESDGKHKLFAYSVWSFTNGKPAMGQYDCLTFFRYDNETRQMYSWDDVGFEVDYYMTSYALPRTGKDIVVTKWNDDGSKKQQTLKWDGQRFSF